MYQAKNDLVIELSTAPKPDIGAPLPTILGDEEAVFLSYIVSEPDPDWDGTWVEIRHFTASFA